MRDVIPASEPRRAREPVRTVARIVLALAYLVAGIAHVATPGGFVRITPGWVPFAHDVVVATGVCEITGALALLFVPKLHKAAGIAFAAYAICVFPANINHAVNNIALGGTTLSWWYHGPRLALQPVIVWWGLWAAGATDWPFRKSAG
ncbi:DoxX family protein [Sphingomonas sp. SUN039]|uniref:DoxX family protein n=1 Tax=Sphingomonas sp. SUN039 TaxID=2937787 RepID=UPI0021648F7A|nr:DoxX family protein [Sphingomonas sp. SUN039]UVO55028.1 DoxX family protein [Sphingomonas sp. SUN039]